MVYVDQHKRQERDVSPGSKRYGTKLQQDFNDYVFLQTYTPFFFNKKDFFLKKKKQPTVIFCLTFISFFNYFRVSGKHVYNVGEKKRKKKKKSLEITYMLKMVVCQPGEVPQ